MAEVTLTKISDHQRTRRPQENYWGYTIGQTHAGHSQWTLVWGEGQNRKSRTLHCSKADAEKEKSRVKGVE